MHLEGVYRIEVICSRTDDTSLPQKLTNMTNILVDIGNLQNKQSLIRADTQLCRHHLDLMTDRTARNAERNRLA